MGHIILRVLLHCLCCQHCLILMCFRWLLVGRLLVGVHRKVVVMEWVDSTCHPSLEHLMVGCVHLRVLVAN